MKPTWETNDGAIRLYCADCLDVLPTLEAGSVDAVVTDPPYGKKTHDGVRSHDKQGEINQPLTFDFITFDDLHHVFGLCRPRRWLVSFIEWRFCLPLEENPPAGLEFIRMGVWTKPNGMPQLTGDRPGTGWEAIAILHSPGKKRWNGGGKCATWNHGTSRYGWFGPSFHPTEKPVGLVASMIVDFSDFGETILDPFMGSGTTGVACIRTGRRFIGIEKEERYFKIAVDRIQKELDRFPLLEPKQPTQGSLLP